MSIDFSFFWLHVFNLFILTVLLHNFNWIIDSLISARFYIQRTVKQKLEFKDNFVKCKTWYRNIILEKTKQLNKLGTKILCLNTYFKHKVKQVFDYIQFAFSLFKLILSLLVLVFLVLANEKAFYIFFTMLFRLIFE